MFNGKYTTEFVLLIIVSRENDTLFLIFYEICNENLKFCTKRYMSSTCKVNEHI